MTVEQRMRRLKKEEISEFSHRQFVDTTAVAKFLKNMGTDRKQAKRNLSINYPCLSPATWRAIRDGVDLACGVKASAATLKRKAKGGGRCGK